MNDKVLGYDFNGTRHHMLCDEIDAIERSGRSVDAHGTPMTVQGYAAWSGVSESADPMSPVVPLMAARPGAVEPGLRPAQEVVIKPRVDRPSRRMNGDGYLHMHLPMMIGPACGAKANRADVYGYHRFEHVVDHAMSCPKCKHEWTVEWAIRKRKEDVAMAKRHDRSVMVSQSEKAGGYIKRMRWTKEEKANLRAYRNGGSTMGSSGKRVAERGSATDYRTQR